MKNGVECQGKKLQDMGVFHNPFGGEPDRKLLDKTDSDLGDVFQESIHHCIGEFLVQYMGIYFYDP